MRIIFFVGHPGTGKTTLGNYYSSISNTRHLSVGDLLRQEHENQTELSHAIYERISKGLLVPDQITVSLLKKNIALAIKDKIETLTIDGFPRSLGNLLEWSRQFNGFNKYDHNEIIKLAKDYFVSATDDLQNILNEKTQPTLKSDDIHENELSNISVVGLIYLTAPQNVLIERLTSRQRTDDEVMLKRMELSTNECNILIPFARTLIHISDLDVAGPLDIVKKEFNELITDRFNPEINK